MNTKTITTPISSTSPLFQRMQGSNFKGDKTMKQYFYILFGGIGLGWLICMMIIISYALQG